MKKAKKQILGLTTAGLTAGIGATAVSSMGGIASTNTATGISNTTRFFPVAGTLIGSGMVYKQVRKLQPKKKRRKR